MSFSQKAQFQFLEWIRRGALQVVNLEDDDLNYILDRMQKYSDRPMDLADSSLMCLAERSGINQIFTLDSDFSIYKKLNGKRLKNIVT